MGKFIDTSEVSWPAKAKIPKGDGTTKMQVETFTCRFEVLTEEDRESHPVIDTGNATIEEIREYNRKMTEIALNSLTGWELIGADFSDVTMRTKVLNNPYYRKAITQAFWDAQNGAETKN